MKSAARPRRSERPKGAKGRPANLAVGLLGLASSLPSSAGGPHESGFDGTNGMLNEVAIVD